MSMPCGRADGTVDYGADHRGRSVEDDILCLDGAIYPRMDLTSNELKVLGESIARWAEEARTEGVLQDLSGQELGDLLSGELPTPYSVRWSTLLKGIKRKDPDAECRVIEEGIEQFKGGDRMVRFSVNADEDGNIDRIVAGLRKHVSEDLIVDVRIEETSWNDKHR